MAAKNMRTLTVQLEAGNASMIDLGKMLGPMGVPPHEVKKRYDAETADRRGETIPAVIAVGDDRSWTMTLKTPPTSSLIRAAIRGQGSPRPGHVTVGTLTRSQVRDIALRKLPDLNTTDLESAMRQIEGTARSMGVYVSE